MANQIKGDDVKLSGTTRVRVTREGLNKITTNGLKLLGGDSSNYTLLGEAHEFLFELKAKFKALQKIENKINELCQVEIFLKIFKFYIDTTFEFCSPRLSIDNLI